MCQQVEVPAPVLHVVWGLGSKGNIVVLRGRDAYTCAAIVAWHLPIKLDTTIQIPCPVLVEFVFCLDAFD